MCEKSLEVFSSAPSWEGLRRLDSVDLHCLFAFGSNLLKTVFGYCKSRQVKVSEPISRPAVSMMNCCALSLLLGK